MIVLRKTLTVTKGELNLFDAIRYFFYITNDWKKSSETLVSLKAYQKDIFYIPPGINDR